MSRPGVAPHPLRPLMDLPGVTEAAAHARADLDRLLSHAVLRRSSAQVSAESLLRGARASAELDGAGYQLEAVRGGHVDDPVLTGALRVSGVLGRLADTFARAPLQALAALHLQAAESLATRDELGRPRSSPDVAHRLHGLADLVTAPRSREVPGVVLAAVVHAEILAVRPFQQANGVVARAASRLVLVTVGVDPKTVAVPEVGHVDDPRRYLSALEGYRSGTADGLADWLTHCCAAMSTGAVEGLAICEAVRRG